jgi:hypothetical protein
MGTDIDLRGVLTSLAAEAAEPPADLLDRVESGRRRYRRRRAATAAFAAVAVLAVGAWAAVARPAADRADTPLTAPALHLPSSLAKPLPMHLVWPGSLPISKPPGRVDDNEPVHVVARTDEVSLLTAGRDTLYRLDTMREVFYPLVTDTGVDAIAHPDRIAVTPTSIVWLADRDTPDEYGVYRSPLGGGSRTLVAVIRAPGGPRGLYATDDHAWWSNATGGGVLRVSLSDGSTSRPAGFDGLVAVGTAWATSPGDAPTVFRNLVTGVERRVVRAADVATLECVPAFCLGDLAGRPGSWFVQRPDGSDRTMLTYPGEPTLVGAMGDSGLLVVDNRVLLDPTTGRFAAAPWDTGATCDVTYATLKDDVVLQWSDGPCTETWVAYLGAAD